VLIRNNVEGIMDWRKSRITSVKITGPGPEIWNQNIPDTKRKCYQWDTVLYCKWIPIPVLSGACAMYTTNFYGPPLSKRTWVEFRASYHGRLSSLFCDATSRKTRLYLKIVHNISTIPFLKFVSDVSRVS